MDEAVCCYRYRWPSKGSWYHYTCHSLRKLRATKQYIKRHRLLVLTFFSETVIGFLSTGSPKNITSQIFCSEKFLNLLARKTCLLHKKNGMFHNHRTFNHKQILHLRTSLLTSVVEVRIHLSESSTDVDDIVTPLISRTTSYPDNFFVHRRCRCLKKFRWLSRASSSNSYAEKRRAKLQFTAITHCISVGRDVRLSRMLFRSSDRIRSCIFKQITVRDRHDGFIFQARRAAQPSLTLSFYIVV